MIMPFRNLMGESDKYYGVRGVYMKRLCQYDRKAGLVILYFCGFTLNHRDFILAIIILKINFFIFILLHWIIIPRFAI